MALKVPLITVRCATSNPVSAACMASLRSTMLALMRSCMAELRNTATPRIDMTTRRMSTTSSEMPCWRRGRLDGWGLWTLLMARGS